LIPNGEILFSQSKDVLFYEYRIFKGRDGEVCENQIMPYKKAERSLLYSGTSYKENKVFSLKKPTFEDIILFYVEGSITNVN